MSLKGVRVMELAGLGPGPLAAAMLADLGADVIRVDRVVAVQAEGREPLGAMMRGRRSIRLDLRRPAGAEVLLRLLEDADVLIDPFRPGVLERLGIGPDVCLERHRELLIARMTGYGQTGPMSGKAGHDINYVALAGVLAHIGDPAAPPPPPLSLIGDFGGGTMFLLVGILAGLLEVRAGGAGQVIDVAMVDGAVSLMSLFYDALAGGGWRAERGSNRLDGAAPFYRCYEAADDRYIAVGANEHRFYLQLLRGLDLDGEDLPDQHDIERWPELRERFAAKFRTRTRDEWVTRFEDLDACVTPVLTMTEAPERPHHRARSTFRAIAGVPNQPAIAPRLPSAPEREYTSIPTAGEHTTEILTEAHFSAQEIERLAADGVIAAAGRTR